MKLMSGLNMLLSVFALTLPVLAEPVFKVTKSENGSVRAYWPATGGGWGLLPYNGYFQRVDSTGNMLWFRKCNAFKVRETLDRGWIVLGNRNGYSELTRFDSSGNLLWNRSYSAFPTIYRSVFVETTDSGFVLANEARGGTDSTRGLLAKVDSRGNPLWYREYRGFASYEITNLDTLAHGGVQVSVNHVPNNAGEPTTLTIAQFDSVGNPGRILQDAYPDHRQSMQDVHRIGNGETVVLYKDFVWPEAFHFLARVDSLGIPQLNHDLTLPDVNWHSVLPTESGYYLLGQRAFRPAKVVFTKCDLAGNILWHWEALGDLGLLGNQNSLIFRLSPSRVGFGFRNEENYMDNHLWVVVEE